MTELLERALEAVRRTPPGLQDEIAELLLDMVDDNEVQDIPAEHLAAVLDGEEQAARGEFATEPQVATALRRFEG